MKDRQRCQSEAEARLSVGSAIAVPAITISLKGSISTAKQHRREEPKADCQLGSAVPAIEQPCAIRERFCEDEACLFENPLRAAVFWMGHGPYFRKL